MSGTLAVEVDHIFVSTSVGAPEGQHLVDLGLLEGTRTVIPARALPTGA